MRIIALIDDDSVIEGIVRQAGAWVDEEPAVAASGRPPSSPEITRGPYLENLPCGEFDQVDVP